MSTLISRRDLFGLFGAAVAAGVVTVMPDPANALAPVEAVVPSVAEVLYKSWPEEIDRMHVDVHVNSMPIYSIYHSPYPSDYVSSVTTKLFIEGPSNGAIIGLDIYERFSIDWRAGGYRFNGIGYLQEIRVGDIPSVNIGSMLIETRDVKRKGDDRMRYSAKLVMLGKGIITSFKESR